MSPEQQAPLYAHTSPIVLQAGLHVPFVHTRSEQHGAFASHELPDIPQVSLTQIPALPHSSPEQQSLSFKQPSERLLQSEAPLHLSSMHAMPSQHATSTRQCSPCGAHAQVPSMHAYEQQSACELHAAAVRPQFADGCQPVWSQAASTSASTTTRIMAADIPPSVKPRSPLSASSPSSADRATRASSTERRQ
jgi:hypothetical protein